jgi:hypothetical protein
VRVGKRAADTGAAWVSQVRVGPQACFCSGVHHKVLAQQCLKQHAPLPRTAGQEQVGCSMSCAHTQLCLKSALPPSPAGLTP